MIRSLPSVAAMLLFTASASSHAADTCETIRASIETQIAGKGVTGFTITVVDDGANAPGKVVGHCDNGSKKILYARSPDAAKPVAPATSTTAATPAPAPKPAPAAQPVPASPVDDVITECKDGSVSMGGNCKH